MWYKRVGDAFIDLRRRNGGRLLLMPTLGPRYGVIPDRGYLELSLTGTLIAGRGTVPIRKNRTSSSRPTTTISCRSPKAAGHC